MDTAILNALYGFQWDEGNYDKNWLKHGVTQGESEQIFFNEPLLLFEDDKHSGKESRYFVLGKTDNGRKLFIAFTVRGDLIRIISARDMSKRERIIYDKV